MQHETWLPKLITYLHFRCCPGPNIYICARWCWTVRTSQITMLVPFSVCSIKRVFGACLFATTTYLQRVFTFLPDAFFDWKWRRTDNMIFQPGKSSGWISLATIKLGSAMQKFLLQQFCCGNNIHADIRCRLQRTRHNVLLLRATVNLAFRIVLRFRFYWVRFFTVHHQETNFDILPHSFLRYDTFGIT